MRRAGLVILGILLLTFWIISLVYYAASAVLNLVFAAAMILLIVGIFRLWRRKNVR